MPCNDVTESLQVRFNAEGGLELYAFAKKTCGGQVGNYCKLLPMLKGKSAEEILAIQPAAFMEEHPAAGVVEEFIHLKHLLALQSLCAALTGQTAAGLGEECTLVEVYYDEEGRLFADSDIMVELLTERIESCGACGDCGSAKASNR